MAGRGGFGLGSLGGTGPLTDIGNVNRNDSTNNWIRNNVRTTKPDDTNDRGEYPPSEAEVQVDGEEMHERDNSVDLDPLRSESTINSHNYNYDHGHYRDHGHGHGHGGSLEGFQNLLMPQTPLQCRRDPLQQADLQLQLRQQSSAQDLRQRRRQGSLASDWQFPHMHQPHYRTQLDTLSQAQSRAQARARAQAQAQAQTQEQAQAQSQAQARVRAQTEAQSSRYHQFTPADPASPFHFQHTDPLINHQHHHFISLDPKQTAAPAPRHPISSPFSLPSSPYIRHQFSQSHPRFSPQNYDQFGAGHDQVHCGIESNETFAKRGDVQYQAGGNLERLQTQQQFNGVELNRPLPTTPISPTFPGPRWDSLPNRGQNTLPNPAATGIARTSDAPIFPDPSHPPASLRSPQSASFSTGTHSHCFIPEGQALDSTYDSSDNHRYEHAAPLTPGQPSKMYRPESRQSGGTANSRDNHNFSRPRKQSILSINQPDFSGAVQLRPGTAKSSKSSNSDIVRLESGTIASSTSYTPYLPSNPGPRLARQPSIASNMSTSTFASAPPSLQHKISHDRFGAHRNISQNAATGNNMGLPHTVRPHSPLLYHRGPYTQHQQSPYLYEDEMRSSLRSQLTTSTAQDTLFTEAERSSVTTKTSSVFSTSFKNGHQSSFFGPHDPSPDIRESLSVDDVMGMYEQGFNDSDMDLIRLKSNMDVPVVRLSPGGTFDHDDSRPGSTMSRNSSEVASRLLEAMHQQSSPIPIPGRSFPLNGDNALVLPDRNAYFRKSLASSLPKDMRLSFIESEQRDKGDAAEADADDALEVDSGRHSRHDSGKMVEPRSEDSSPIDDPEKDEKLELMADDITYLRNKEMLSPEPPRMTDIPPSQPAPPQPVQGAPQPEDLDPDANDRYGFRKQNQYVTRQQYDEWNGQYTEYLARRRKKWEVFLKENRLMTDHPNRFPQHSAKAKRFVRKGIPPDWRGAAWFYYAGGPNILANNQGVYDNMLKRSQNGHLKDVCRDDIERDLYRTFPDNVRFRRTASTSLSPGKASPSQAHIRNHSTQSANPTPKAPGTEPEIIARLRRVLSAFAVFNPSIGYCQSLNFLGGMLLLFVETEEQAFWLLNIITRVYLPGTHEMSLEGSKVDLSVLMAEMQEILPQVFTKISDDGSGAPKKKSRRGRQKIGPAGGDNLPPVTLALTAWFMSCFIGTLPVETTLRVWDVFFYEGSKTLFRVALAIFKAGENEIKSISDPMEVFAVVQTLPRKMLDANTLMDITFKRRSGLNHITSEAIDEKRAERKERLMIERHEAAAAAAVTPGITPAATIAVSRTRNTGDLQSVNSGDGSVRRKPALFGRR